MANGYYSTFVLFFGHFGSRTFAVLPLAISPSMSSATPTQAWFSDDLSFLAGRDCGCEIGKDGMAVQRVLDQTLPGFERKPLAVYCGLGSPLPGSCRLPGQRAPTPKVRFASDSLLEGDGFEPSVPRKKGNDQAALSHRFMGICRLISRLDWLELSSSMLARTMPTPPGTFPAPSAFRTGR
jgi:hypothetical protein